MRPWPSWQRRLEVDGTLHPERKERLAEFGFEFGILDDLKWDKMYERLVKFKEVNGHCRVNAKCKLDPKLARWVEVQQRQMHRLMAASRSPRPEWPGRRHEPVETEHQSPRRYLLFPVRRRSAA